MSFAVGLLALAVSTILAYQASLIWVGALSSTQQLSYYLGTLAFTGVFVGAFHVSVWFLRDSAETLRAITAVTTR